MTDWFEAITGFREQGYDATQARLSVACGRLHSTHSDRSWAVGRLELPTLAELRERAAGAGLHGQGPTRLTRIHGDVRALHRDAAHANALFQVASQFNLLEMVNPQATPEHGVTRYQSDNTQGPACAIAAGAGTIFRNYLVPVGGNTGQRADRQLDGLRDVGAALGNESGDYWRMANGYCMVTADGLARLDARLQAQGERERDQLKGHLRIGLQRGVEVTDGQVGHCVSQAYCSALPVAYHDHPVRRSPHWVRFATLVLEAAYEATLLAAVLNRAAHGVPLVFLTRLGGGAFGNDSAWISAALGKALASCQDAALDVRVVARAAPTQRVQDS